MKSIITSTMEDYHRLKDAIKPIEEKKDINNASGDAPAKNGLIQTPATPEKDDRYLDGLCAEVELCNRDKSEIMKYIEVARQDLVRNLIMKPFVDEFKPTHQNGPDYIIPTENMYTHEPDGAVKLLMNQNNKHFPPMSMVTLLYDSVKKYPRHTALAVKRNGEWMKWTYTDYWNDVRTAAKAFIKLGLEHYHSVCIIGFNSPEWIISKLAAMFSGGFGTGMYTTNSPEACLHILKDSRAQIVVVENDVQLQKIRKIRHRVPLLKAIIQYTDEPTESDVITWKNLLEIGNTVSDEVLEKRLKNLAINQCCALVYTSGTTGNPRGVMLSHDNLSYLARLSTTTAHLSLGYEKVLSYLPLSHIAAQMGDLYAIIAVGGTTYFANPEALKGKLVDCMKEVQPTYIVGVPRIWEKIGDKLKEVMEMMSPLKKKVLKWARSQALHHHTTCQSNNNTGSIAYNLAKKLVLGKIRRALGLKRGHMMLSGGAPLSPDIVNFFASLDIWVAESYGMTESGGPNTSHLDYPMKVGSVGKIFPEIESKIENPNEEGLGEVCMRGRHIFMGYLNINKENQETLDEERWVHTGDIGYFTKENHLFITGRIKEIIITAGGENVAPLSIESKIKEIIPIISQSMVVGDRRKFLSVLLTLKVDVNLETLVPTDRLTTMAQDWCRSKGSNSKTVQDILQEPDRIVLNAIEEGMAEVNEHAISNAQRIQKWMILPVDFSIPGGELGPTLKVKRAFILSKYNNLIDSMYSDI